MAEFKNRIGDYDCHLCKKCWHTTQVEDTDQATAPCAHCGSVAERKVIAPVTIDPQGLFKCGGKNSLSKWEEIKHRPPPGAKSF